MSLGHGSHKRSPWWCWVVMLLAAAVTLPGAALVVGADEQAESDVALSAEHEGSPDVTSPDSQSEPLQQRAYYLDDLITSAGRELGLNERAAKELLLRKVGNLAANPDATRRPHWDANGMLVVRDTLPGHNLIGDQLDAWHKHGSRQITIEAQWITAPRCVFDDLKIDPSVFSSNLATFDNDGERAPASWTFAVINPQRASSLVDRLNWLGHLRLDPDAAEPHVHDAFRQAIQKLLSREDRPRLAEQIRVTPTREVTLFRGQPGMITDRSLMPIFRGVKPVPGESGKTVDVVATHLMNDGLKLQLVPFFLEGGHVRLECRLTLSSVFDAREVDTSVELSVGQTLLIGANGLKHKDGAGDEQAMLLMVRPARITPFSDSVSQGLLTNVHYYVGALKPRDFDSLIELITTTVDPESWRTMGGQGIIAQSSTNRILIRQTSEAHAQIVNLLAGLRHRRDERRQWERVRSIGARHPRGAVLRRVPDTNMETMISFVEGSAEMLDGEESEIGVIASEVRDEPRTIEVRGHTTARPLADDSPYRNHEDLAYQRAFQIRETLIQMGIDKSRILLTVAGASEPLHIGHDPEKLKQNARVEVNWGARGPASFLIAR